MSAYFVVGSASTNGRPVDKVVLEAVKAGVSAVQLREKDAQGNSLDAGHVYKSAVQILDKFDELECPPLFLVNDRVDVAVALYLNGYQVHGVHIGQDDLSVTDVRKMFDAVGFEDAVIGLSARTEEALAQATELYNSSIINYVGVGPVHTTSSKPNLPEGLGYQRWGELRKFVKQLAPELQVVAIGGLTPVDAKPLQAAGADGYCCISYIGSASDVTVAAKEFVKQFVEVKEVKDESKW